MVYDIQWNKFASIIIRTLPPNPQTISLQDCAIINNSYIGKFHSLRQKKSNYNQKVRHPITFCWNSRRQIFKPQLRFLQISLSYPAILLKMIEADRVIWPHVHKKGENDLYIKQYTKLQIHTNKSLVSSVSYDFMGSSLISSGLIALISTPSRTIFAVFLSQYHLQGSLFQPLLSIQLTSTF
jgi:hypothetical protein